VASTSTLPSVSSARMKLLMPVSFAEPSLNPCSFAVKPGLNLLPVAVPLLP